MSNNKKLMMGTIENTTSYSKIFYYSLFFYEDIMI